MRFLTLLVCLLLTQPAFSNSDDDDMIDQSLHDRTAALKETYEKLKVIVENPATKEIVRLSTDPKLQQAITKVKNSDQWKPYLFSVLALMISIFVFRVWFLGKKIGKLKKIFFSLLLTLFFWLGATLILPYFFFKDSYFVLIDALKQVFMSIWKQ